MNNPKLNPLVAAVALATAAGTSYAQEQSTDMAMLEEVVVTGFRSSLESALNTKREAAGSVDAIYAEDIADFPDQNLAESLQRIPGVAITRDAGEGRNISVRGLGPQFTRVQINGMEAMSSTGATDSSGGANRSRSFDFNTFASELFTELAVVKTSSASIDEGSLGATVQLQTARPLDYEDNFVLSVNGQMGYNDLSDETDPRVSGLIAGSNDSGTFGWLASVSYTERSLLEEGFSTVRWDTSNAWRTEPGNPGDASEYFFPRIPRYGKLTHEQDRLGFTGTLQFRPTDRTDIVFDALVSQFDAQRSEEFLEALVRGNNDSTDLVSYTVDDNNTMTTGVLNDANIRIENRYDELTTDFQQFTLDVSHEFSDRLRVHALLGTSESDFENPVQTTIIFDNANVSGYSWDITENSELPQVGFGGYDVTDPDNFMFTNVRDRPNTTVNEFNNFSFDGEFDFNDSMSVSAGVSVKEYSFAVTEVRRDTSLSGIDGIDGPLPVTDDLYSITSMGDGLGAPDGTVLTWLSPNVGAAAERVGLYDIEADFTTRARDNRSVDEDTTGLFAQFNWNTEIAGMSFRGNAGVRHIETDIASTGYQSVDDEFVQTTVENSYSDTLPAVNTVLEVAENMLVRASWSKVMTRPGLGSLTAHGSVDGFNNAVSYGNPKLDPFRADSLDLSWEWYFADGALLSIAYFEKDVESFIKSDTFENVPWSEIGLPDSILDNLPAEPSDTFDVSRNYNGEGGTLDGFEIQYQQPITEHFGTILNYTKVDSRMNYGSPEDPVYNQLEGMSPTSYNATVYYETDTFGARVSYAFRDDYLTDAQGRNGNDEGGTKATSNVDAVLSYNMNENIKFTLEGINLTDEFNHQYVDSSERVYVYHHTGRQFYLGAQYKF